jgi:tRNA modification GTPase
MDLVQAEAVRDLIASQTRYQAEVAREQLEGLISKQVTPIRDKLVDAVSHLETRLEFVEDDVDPGSREAIWKNLDEARETLRELSDSFGVGRLLREGLTVAIAGRPNVGKSSLFNTLLRFERAIVTPIPGTTRDALREWIEVEGVPVCLVDTAGIRSSGDQLEMLGVDRTGRELKGSDLVLFVTDGSEGFLEDDQKVWDSLKGHSYIIVMNKSDLKGGAYPPEGVLSGSLGMVRVSAKTGGNIEGLVQKIGDFTGAAQAAEGGRPVVTNLRQKDCLDRAIRELEQGQTALMQGLSEEFVSEDLRRCLAALEELVGETTTNTILERIFSTFCIGK